MSDLIAPSTFAGTRGQAPKTVGEYFSTAILTAAENDDVFSQMEGDEASGRPFIVKQDLSKGGGNVVNFTTLATLGGRGRMGEQRLVGNEEKPRFGTFNARVEIIRHAVGWTQKMEAFLSTGRSVEPVFGKLLGSWFGRKRQSDMMIMLRNKPNAANAANGYAFGGATARNTYLINGHGFDQLLSTDTLSTAVITGAKGMLVGLGCPSANLTKKKSKAGSVIKQYLFFATNVGLNSLKGTSSYLTAAQYAQDRGENNTLFAGGYTDWDGNGIFEYNVMDPDTTGPIGCPILPRALLGTAIAPAGGAAFNITGSGIATPSPSDYPFDWFLGYDYPFFEEQIPNPDANTYGVVIVNMSGADVGKYGVCTYLGSTNDGNKLPVVQYLGPTATGSQVTTLLGQTWNSNIHTVNHPTGSVIFQVNAKCVPVAWAFMFGAGSAVRAYGNLGGKRSGKSIDTMKEEGDYEMNEGRGMAACYGQAPAQDTLNQARRYVLIPHAVQHPEVPSTLNVTS